MIIRQMRRDNRPTNSAASFRCRHATAVRRSDRVDAQIAAFLDGKTNGEDLLHALYDHVLDEPIPPSLSDVLRR